MITILPHPHEARLRPRPIRIAKWLDKFDFDQETYLVVTERFVINEREYVYIEDSKKRSLRVKAERLKLVRRKARRWKPQPSASAA